MFNEDDIENFVNLTTKLIDNGKNIAIATFGNRIVIEQILDYLFEIFGQENPFKINKNRII